MDVNPMEVLSQPVLQLNVAKYVQKSEVIEFAYNLCLTIGV